MMYHCSSELETVVCNLMTYHRSQEEVPEEAPKTAAEIEAAVDADQRRGEEMV